MFVFCYFYTFILSKKISINCIKQMKKITIYLQLFLAVLFFAACKQPVSKDLTKENLIPKPVKIEATGSSFEWTKNTVIYTNSTSAQKVGTYLSDFIAPATGFHSKVKQVKDITKAKGVILTIDNNLKNLGNEGYQLKITEKKVLLTAPKPAGLFYGVQTIRQIFPDEIEADTVQENIPWLLATGTITDYPNYAYRGAMLDVARHFFSVADIKKYIDYLAAYKMNRFHIHLTDDQGWRIEIKKYPKLTQIGASTQVGGGKGGFYTQKEYIDIVNYANKRFITIVPEIDMPGHTNAALSAYAELNINGKATKPYTGTDVGFSTLDKITKKYTYSFVRNVIEELAAINPGEYIHIGGDESRVTKEKDYIDFVNGVQKIVARTGKKVMGWADIAQAKLNKGTLPQFWQTKPTNALKAIAQGNKIIMSPASYTYMDLKYNKNCKLGLVWAGYVDVKKGYNWNPDSLVPQISRKNIVGIEAPLWTETIANLQDIQFMIFPRLLGYAEIGWSPATHRNWNEYRIRLANQQKRFNLQDINFYRSPLVPWKAEK